MTTTTGAKFESVRNFAIATIAAHVRADIKSAVAAGKLPRAKYSVKSSSYSMGRSIDIVIGGLADSFVMFNPKRLAWDAANPHACMTAAPIEVFAIYSDGAHALRLAVEAIANEYKRTTTSNEADDYHNTSFHLSVEFASEARSMAREREVARCALATAETMPAPELPANDVDGTFSAQHAYLAAMGAI